MLFDSVRHWVAFKGGSVLLRREQWRPAAFLLHHATKVAPDHWESHTNLAVAFLKLERWTQAADVAERAIRLNPTADDSYVFFGIALLQLERWDEAAAAYRRAITMDPDRYDSYDRLGIALVRLERWNEVVETYEAALKLDAGHHTAHHRLGVALLRLGRWDAAAAALRRAIALALDDPAAAAERVEMMSHLAMAVAQLEASGEVLMATLLQQAEVLQRGAADRLNRGIALLKAEQCEEALAELETLPPDLGGAHFLRVDPLIRLGRVAEAVTAHHLAVAAGGVLPPLPGPPAATRYEHRQASFWTSDNLSADAFAAERWLEQLSVVPAEVTAGPRLLFVLDNDFGELATVKFFILGQDLAARATLLLPERLYVHNVDAIPGRTFQYGSVEDILQAVDREQPEVVLLCSGYLLCPHLEFTPDSLARLIDRLRERGCRVVTADPFLGMLSKQDPQTLIRFDLAREHGTKLAAVAGLSVEAVEDIARSARAAEERAWASFAQSEKILRNTYHLYPSYCDVAEDDRAQTDARNVAFFNDRLVRPVPSTPVGVGTPHWLFILASKLVETLAAGRHPILIGPRAFIGKLVTRMPTAEGIDILSQCPFTQFYSLLLSAEHAFYWNIVSHSLLMRFYNQLPIVQFDRGHLIRSAPAIYDRIVGWYYQGWEPTLRDHREPLTLERVEGWAEDYRRQAGRLVARYRRAPSPDQMIADIMGRAQTPELPPRVSAR
jgi:Flp pilus assembly protein TadD